VVKTVIRRVVGYARVSSDSQRDNTSIEDQRRRIEAYCVSQGWDLAHMFIDDGETGSKTESRDAYNAMIDFITNPNNGITAIVVLKADRIHRKLRNMLNMIEDVLEPAGVAFVSVSENFDTSTAQGMLFLQMIGGFAEFERKIINQRTQSGRVNTASSEKYAGGSVPFGYIVLDGKIVADDEQSKIVKSVFNLAKEGKSLQKIADWLNGMGIPTQRGNQWSKQTVDYLLKNRAYIGEYEYNGKREQNGIRYKIDAIVSKQLWNKVHVK